MFWFFSDSICRRPSKSLKLKVVCWSKAAGQICAAVRKWSYLRRPTSKEVESNFYGKVTHWSIMLMFWVFQNSRYFMTRSSVEVSAMLLDILRGTPVLSLGWWIIVHGFHAKLDLKSFQDKGDWILYLVGLIRCLNLCTHHSRVLCRCQFQ